MTVCVFLRICSARAVQILLYLTLAAVEEGLADSPSSTGPDLAAAATIVVYNSSYPESKALAEYYATRRKVPADQIVALSCPIDEEIERDEYDTSIAEPLRERFSRQRWWNTLLGSDLQTRVTANRIRFVALIRGIPLKIRFKSSYQGDHRTRPNRLVCRMRPPSTQSWLLWDSSPDRFTAPCKTPIFEVRNRLPRLAPIRDCF